MGIWPAIVFSLTLPPALEGVALNAVRAAARGDDTLELANALAFAAAFARPSQLHPLVASSVPSAQGGVQSRLMGALPSRGPDAVPYVPVLAAVLLDPASPNRSEAAITLSWIGPPAIGAVPALKLCLRPDNAPPPPPFVWVNDPAFPELDGLRAENVVRVKMGPGPEPVGDIGLRFSACLALWRIERKTDTILPVIIAALDGGWPEEQSEALTTIRIIGVDLKAAVGPKILGLLSSRHDRVRHEALSLVPVFAADHDAAAKLLIPALRRGDATSAALNQRFHDGELTLEEYAYARHIPTDSGPAASALSALGPAAVGPLLTLLDDPVSQFSAVRTLGRLGKAGRPATDALLKLATGPNSAVRYEARRALESIEKE